ncbi:ATP-binding protein [Actinomadura latina]|uniref:ATP-binding protein n=2 Tax=Actinomadura latina TaxID=163603 RepID=A0A846ZBD0_9ACTN|nr:ATP-binding protein [Actinomadura latina]NKZ07815.1 ATP-binding protein [Actinomadura latina]
MSTTPENKITPFPRALRTSRDRRFTFTYLATPATVGIARKAAKQASLALGCTGEKAENVCLVVSELVTNSVHAAEHTGIRVTVAEDVPGHITVEVWDESADLPQRRLPGPMDVSGRGLGIVETLAVHCGVRRENGGKAVYAVL